LKSYFFFSLVVKEKESKKRKGFKKGLYITNSVL